MHRLNESIISRRAVNEYQKMRREFPPCASAGRVGPGRAAVGTTPCVTMGSLYKQCWLLHTHKKNAARNF